MNKTKKIIFFLLHGIRTSEKENLENYRKFKEVVDDYYKHTEIEPVVNTCYYSYISVFANLIPYLRKLLIKTIATQIFNLQSEINENTKIVVVSFSYGTWLTSHIFQNYNYIIDSWVLFGGVEHCNFNFKKLKSSIQNVLNFCSTKDEVAKFAPSFFDYGNCGCWGFRKENGLQADIKKSEEVVWEASDKNPKVTNFHFNIITHGKWFKSCLYILTMLDNIMRDKFKK